MRHQDERDALGYIQEYRQDARFLPAGPENVGGAGVAVAVVGDVRTEQPAADDDGKRDRAEDESRHRQQNRINYVHHPIP